MDDFYTPTANTQEPPKQDSVNDLIKLISEFTQRVAANNQTYQAPPPYPSAPLPHSPTRFPQQATPGGVISNPPQRNYSRNPRVRIQSCRFCSALDHHFLFCPVALQYIQQGKIIEDKRSGKLLLPNGLSITYGSPGRNLQERVDNYWRHRERCRRNQNASRAAATHFFGVPDEYQPPFDVPAARYREGAFPPPQNDFRSSFEQSPSPEDRVDELRDTQTLRPQWERKSPSFLGRNVPVPRSPSQTPAAFVPRLPPSCSEHPSVPAIIARSETRAEEPPYRRPRGPMIPLNTPPEPPAEYTHYRAPVETSAKIDGLVSEPDESTTKADTVDPYLVSWLETETTDDYSDPAIPLLAPYSPPSSPVSSPNPLSSHSLPLSSRPLPPSPQSVPQSPRSVSRSPRSFHIHFP
jgi:hypothetical protein